MKREFIKSCICVSIILFCFTTSIFSVDFIRDKFHIAVQQAITEDKPIMIFFYTDWCGWCKLMDKHVFSNQKLTDFSSKELVSLRINAEKRESIFITKKLKVRSFPTVIFLNTSTKEIRRINGFLSPKDFLVAARSVVHTYRSNQ